MLLQWIIENLSMFLIMSCKGSGWNLVAPYQRHSVPCHYKTWHDRLEKTVFLCQPYLGKSFISILGSLPGVSRYLLETGQFPVLVHLFAFFFLWKTNETSGFLVIKGRKRKMQGRKGGREKRERWRERKRKKEIERKTQCCREGILKSGFDWAWKNASLHRGA